MMLIYENDRTKSIVSQLISIGKAVRLVTIVSCVILLGVILSLVGVSFLSDLWWLGGLGGIALGYMLGSYIASLFTVVIEWMAQLLVAQGEIVAALKKMS